MKQIHPHPDKVLGLDYSSKALYIDHTDASADYPKYLRKMEDRLKKEQRVLSRRKKGGSNWNKQKLRVARLHEKVSNQRKDFLHKLSKDLAETWDAVAVEDLNMSAMSQALCLGKATMDNGNGLKNFPWLQTGRTRKADSCDSSYVLGSPHFYHVVGACHLSRMVFWCIMEFCGNMEYKIV